VSKLETNILEKHIIIDKLNEKANQESLDKFMEDVYLLKGNIEKKIETFVNGELSEIKLLINKKCSNQDFEQTVETLATKAETEQIKEQLGQVDFRK